MTRRLLRRHWSSLDARWTTRAAAALTWRSGRGHILDEPSSRLARVGHDGPRSRGGLRAWMAVSLPIAFILAIATLAPSPALASESEEGFGIVPGSFTSGTYTSTGAAGPLGEGAAFDTQAGDHPFEQSVDFKLNTTAAPARPTGDLKEVKVELPPGFIGDPNATPRCAPAFLSQNGYCANDTVIGVASVRLYWGGVVGSPDLVPVYNMTPDSGTLGLFDFHIDNPSLNVAIHPSLRTATNYGVTATVAAISTSAVTLESNVTLWGVPADASHDGYRGNDEPGHGCLSELAELDPTGKLCPSDAPVRAFLRNPTSCGGPLRSTLILDSWEEPEAWHEAEASAPPVQECEDLRFEPSIEVTPESSAIDSPTGVRVNLRVPQNEDPYGLATSDLRNAVVTLPAGLAISPSAASGLEGCTPAEIGLHTEDPIGCPSGSKLGRVHVSSPDLPENANGTEGELSGAVYLGAPASGPIASPPYTLYLVAEGYGLSIRLQGTVSANPTTGQLTTTFDENPPLPFDDLGLDFFGGPRAALMTPPACGSYTTTSQLTPYSSATAATPSSTFATSLDGAGAACPTPLTFAPSFDAGTTNAAAGAFGSFLMNIAKPDGEQALSTVSLTMPPGLLGLLSSVSLCGEAEANAGSCSSASQIGTASAAAGAGSEPFYTTGSVYLTGPYRGAPFGLSVAIPAVAGPFNFGTVIVRSAIYVDPQTSQITVVSDPLPQMVDTSATSSGIPVALQKVSVDIDRPGFIFNPTDCNGMSVAGLLSSNQGASESVSSPFQVTGCPSLPFKPAFSASSQALTSKPYGASLTVKVGSSSGEANIAKVDVTMPRQLPARLSTLQKACTEAQFASNPAGCPEGSIVGYATVHTPVLKVPMTGPAIMVSHGGEAFPDLVLMLQGEGVTIELVGHTEIKKSVTYSRFESVPDAPVSSFELQLPESKHSILGTNLPASAKNSLCGQSLVMPTSITGQNGAVVKQPTRIVVTGCPKKAKTASIARKASKPKGRHR